MTKLIIFDLLHLFPCFPRAKKSARLENCVDSWRWWQQEVDIPIQTVGCPVVPPDRGHIGCYGNRKLERLGKGGRYVPHTHYTICEPRYGKMITHH